MLHKLTSADVPLASALHTPPPHLLHVMMAGGSWVHQRRAFPGFNTVGKFVFSPSSVPICFPRLKALEIRASPVCLWFQSACPKVHWLPVPNVLLLERFLLTTLCPVWFMGNFASPKRPGKPVGTQCVRFSTAYRRPCWLRDLLKTLILKPQ